MASQDGPPVSQPSPAPSGPKDKPKQMILTDDLRTHIGDVLACESEKIAIQESNKVCIRAPVLHKDFREGNEERHPRLKFYQGMKIIENILQSKMENFTKPMAENAEFRSRLPKSVWVGQAPEKHHHTSISRKPMAMFTANKNSKRFAIQAHGIIIEVHYCQQCQDNSVDPAAISGCRVRNQKHQKHLKIVSRLRH
jgi:hypothetical protein